jgi:UPF0716 protein FxsA
MLVALLVIFVLGPIAEIYVIIQVGEAIGVLPTLALLIADSVLGSALLRSQGRAVWRRFNTTLSAGRPPAREVLDGALVIFGGALLLAPGFLTDILGLLLLLPPTRAFVRAALVRRAGSRLVMRAAGTMSGEPLRREPDVEGSAVDVDVDADPPAPRRRR